MSQTATPNDFLADSNNYLSINRARWDERAAHHAHSPDYHLTSLISNPTSLSHALTFDLPLLSTLTSKKVVHLQCHIGTDTLSLARLGASSVTGLDFSAASLAEARDLASRAAGGERLRFVEGDVYDAPELLGKAEFDTVFVNIGSICWIPDIKRWAKVVAELLKGGGGELFIRDVHPALLSIDDLADGGRLVVGFPYFETREGMVSEQEGSYVRSSEGVERLGRSKMVEWNHGIGEVVGAVLEAGLRVVALVEHRTVPFEGVKGQMVEVGGGEWALKEGRDRLPLSFTLRAVKD